MGRDGRFWARVFQLATLAALGYLLLRILQPFFGPIFWALLLALILFPINRRLRIVFKGRRALAATVLTLAVTLGIVVPSALIGVAFARQGTDLARKLSATAERYRIDGVEDVLTLPALGGPIAWLENRFHVDAARLQEWFVHATNVATQFLLTHGKEILVGAFGLLGNLTVMLFILFFFFRDGDAVAARAVRLLPVEDARRDRLVAHLKGVTEAVVLGTIITAIAQGILVAVAFWITGLPSPVVFGVLTGIASFVPFVGTSIVILPATVYLAVTEGIWWKAVFLAAWGFLIAGSADNILKPLLIAGRAEIGTLPVFLGVIGGLAAFGLAGLFLGPVLVALALVLLRFAEESKKESEAVAVP
ncbi:MAG: AI-2E family transporter [Thermoanaerobaculia bacterium]